MKPRLFDGHCDTAYELWYRKERLAKNTCHIDLEKASALGGYAQVFAFCSYAGQKGCAPCAQEEFLTLPLNLLRKEVAAHANRAAFARSAGDIRHLNESGRIAVLLSVEGPEVIGCDPERLPRLAELGVSMTTLTWNADNALAGCHSSAQGLSDRGKAFVRMAQRLGMLLDVSHLGDAAFYDLMDITEAPLLASHSNCRALCPNSRNLTDDQLRLIARTGGTVGLNLYPPFLGENADFSTLESHLEHMLRLCGSEHVALGGDLDGCDRLVKGFFDLSSYESFYHYLNRRGYDDRLLDQIFYTNLLNLYERR